MFEAITKEEKARKAAPPVFNSQMDDIEMPDDTDFPPPEALLKLTTELDKKAEALEEDPGTAKPPARPDTPELVEKDIGDEFLSVTSEVNEHSSRIVELSTQIREIDLKVQQVTKLDGEVRSMTQTVSEVKLSVSDLVKSVSELRKGMTQFQTHVASKIADVERRAATKQLSTEAVADPGALIPPSEIVASRGGESSSTGAMPVTPAGPSIADLDDF